MIDSKKLKLTLFVSEAEGKAYRGNLDWKGCKNTSKTYLLKGKQYTLVEKWERYLPFFSSERISLLALGLFCSLCTLGLASLSTTIQRCFTGRQVVRVVKPVDNEPETAIPQGSPASQVHKLTRIHVGEKAFISSYDSFYQQLSGISKEVTSVKELVINLRLPTKELEKLKNHSKDVFGLISKINPDKVIFVGIGQPGREVCESIFNGTQPAFNYHPAIQELRDASQEQTEDRCYYIVKREIPTASQGSQEHVYTKFAQG